MVASDSFAEFLREQLAPLGRVSLRRMFGKTGVFCDGVMLGDGDRQHALPSGSTTTTGRPSRKPRSSPPLNYAKGGSTIDLSFWRAPERLFDEPDELVAWARLALAAARRVASKRGRAAPKRSGTPDDPSRGPCGSQVLGNW